MADITRKEKSKWREIFETISPVLINPTSTSITVGLSKRFLLFKLLNQISGKIEEDPHMNFVSLLKYYKILGRFLEGTIHEFYRDRNKMYFKDFFVYREVYKKVKEDLEYVYKINGDMNVTITKEGIVIYDNYKKNKFNILLLTAHAGTFVPPEIQKKMNLSVEERWKEEDIDSDRLYCKLVLKQGGIWVDVKYSRFYCDLNRNLSRCIYDIDPHNIKKNLWKEPLTKKEIKVIHEYYSMFYSALSRLLESHRFNIIFDAHTMKDLPNRPNISFGTQYIPKFYLPIVKSMRSKMRSMGYEGVAVNKPYGGGFILKWLSTIYQDRFTFSMEINKKLYMTKDRVKVKEKKREKISEDLVHIIDIMEEEGFRMEKKS